MSKRFYLIYKITNNLNQKFYIGKHETNNLDDDYFGSGKHLINAQNKDGLENFTKTILFYCQNREEMNLLEHYVVTPEFCKRKDVYNLNEGGDGGWHYINSEKLNIGFRYANEHGLNNNGDHSLKMNYEVHCKNISDGLRKSMTEHPEKFDKFSLKNPMFGKHHSSKSKRKMSDSHRGTKNSSFGKHWYYNKFGDRKMFYPSDVPNGWFRKS